MPQLIFPNPSETTTYTAAGITWTWNGDLGLWSSEIEADGGGSTSVSVGTSPPADPVQGDLWWNSHSDSGQLFVYYKDTNTEQWVEASPQGSADNLYLSKVNDDTAAGAITFQGQTTHEDGISVTGGNLNTIASAQYVSCIRTHTDVDGVGNGSATAPVNIYGTNTGSVNVRRTISGDTPGVNGKTFNAFSTYLDIEESSNVPEVIHFSAGGRTLGLGDFTGSLRGFSALGSLSGMSDSENVQGFRSELDAGTGVYNFYAAGTAPNFWAGYHLFNGFSKDWSWLSTQPSGIRFGVRSNVAANAQFEITTNRHSGGDDNIAILFTGEKSDSDTTKVVRGAIRVGNTGVAYEETSDYRLKENIQPIANASELINQLNPSTYQFKSDSSVTCHGFLAHELQTVLPRAVSGTKDGTEAIGTLTDYNGTILKTEVTEPSAEELEYTEEVETNGVSTMVTRTRTWIATGTQPVYQGVDQTKLIPLLTKALQEALERIEALENA